MRIGDSFSRKLFNLFNILFMIFLVFVTLYPMLHIAFASLSNASRLMKHQGLIFWPLQFTTAAYRLVMKNNMIGTGYQNTLFVVTAGVFINILLTSIGAYVLSRKNVMWSKHMMFMVVFTMFFSGGLIPTYFTVKELGLENTLWALIIPASINTFNLIIMRTSFMALPESLIESAKLDGAGHVGILFLIVIPLSLPVVAVIILYYAVGHWNSWFSAMLYLKERNLYPLQLVLREILIQNDTNIMSSSASMGDQESVSETIKYAVIMVATIPILCIYPFLQKYFVKGVLVGAVKQ